LKRSTDITITIKLQLKILETMVSMSKSTDSHQLINLFSHNHGEEQRLLTHQMDSRTHHSNGLIRKLFLNKRREILEIMVLMRKFTALLRTINQYYHNHGDVLRKRIQKMVSRTHLSNGSIPKLLLKKIKPILVTRRLLQMSTDSQQPIPVFCQPHTQERSMPSTVY